MNTFNKALLALVAGSVVTMSAQAAVNYGGQPYVGAKVGQYSPDAKGYDDATSYGIYGGMKFTPNFGMEAEYLTTSDADVTTNSVKTAEYKGSTYGLYGTYDYYFPNTGGLYAKGRLGFAKNEIETTNAVTKQAVTNSDTGVAGGIGLGYAISPMVSVEGMYNMYPTIEGKNGAADTDVKGLTLGAHLKF